MSEQQHVNESPPNTAVVTPPRGVSPAALGARRQLSRVESLVNGNPANAASDLIKIDGSALGAVIETMQQQIAAQNHTVQTLTNEVRLLRNTLEGVQEETAANMERVSGQVQSQLQSVRDEISGNTSNGISTNSQQQQQMSSDLPPGAPYMNLPGAFRTSFDFVRREARDQIAALGESLSRRIDTAISKAVYEVVDNARKREENAAEQAAAHLDSKLNAAARQLQDKIAELHHELARTNEKSDEAEATLKTGLQSATTFAQRLEKRFGERMDSMDARSAAIETVLNNHMADFADVTNRIMPLVGGEAMDSAVAASKPFTQAWKQQPQQGSYNVAAASSSSLSPSHNADAGGSSTTRPRRASLVVAPNLRSNNSRRSSRAPSPDPAAAAASPLTVQQSRPFAHEPELLDEQELENAMTSAASGDSAASPSSSSRQQLQHITATQQRINRAHANASQFHQQQQQMAGGGGGPIPSSLVGSVDVEVLAAHDARAIAMLHTAPFVALRHQLLKDTQTRIGAARDAILGELDAHLQELRLDISRRPLPARVAEMIRDMTTDKSLPEQLAYIRGQLSQLETSKISNAAFNDAMRTKADTSVTVRKADTEEVESRLLSLQGNIAEVKNAVASVQTERNQFRAMLREVLYMHRRAQALSGGGAGGEDGHGGGASLAAAMEFAGALEMDDGFGGAGGHTDAVTTSAMTTDPLSGGSMKVRDPALPLIRSQSAYNFDGSNARDPRRQMAATQHQQQQQNSAIRSARAAASQRQPLARQASERRAPPTAPSKPATTNDVNSSPPSSAASPRRAQQLVNSIAEQQQQPQFVSASPPRTAQGSSRRSVGGARQQQQQQLASDISQQEVGTRDMTQQFARKIYTPTTGAHPPLDL